MNLLAELPQRVLEHGPVTVPITPDEYLQVAREARSIFQRQRLNRNDALVFLAFLKGYTEYREVSEHENKFWESFAKELSLRDFYPHNSMYDWLWWVFDQHPLTSQLKIKVNGKRMAVKTIRSVWGYQIMKATDFNRAFEAYFLNPRKTTLSRDFFMQLFPKGDPNLWHHLDTYQKIFEGLSKVLDVLLDHKGQVDLRSQRSILEVLKDSGCVFEEPHPVKYMFCKSETTLSNLVERLRYGGKRRFSVQVKRRRSDAFDLECELFPQVYSTDEQVVVEVVDHQQHMHGVVTLHGGQGHRVQVVQGRANLGFLKEGLHAFEVCVNGQPTGRTLECRVIDGLQVQFHKDSKVLVEGQFYTGEIRRKDGRFELFRFRPGWVREHHTWQVKKQEFVVKLDWEELPEVKVCFEPSSVGVRVMDSRNGALVSMINDLTDLRYLQVHGTSKELLGKHPVCAFVGSQPHKTFSVALGGTLAALEKEVQRCQDEIIVAAALSGHQPDVLTRLMRLKVRLTPVLHFPQLLGHSLHLSGERLMGCRLVLREKSAQGVREVREVFREDTLLLPLEVGEGFEDVTWEVQVTTPAGEVLPVRTVRLSAHERMQKLLLAHLPQGLGWGKFRPAGK